MDFLEIFGILLIALVIGSIFYFGYQRRAPWGAFWIFILILFMSSWAARFWITPVGPVFWGFAWIPVVFFVIIMALLIGALAPRDEKRIEEAEQVKMRSRPGVNSETGAAVGIFFWFLLIMLITAVIAGFLLLPA